MNTCLLFWFYEVSSFFQLLLGVCSCMEYCCLFWAGAPSCYLEFLDKLQNQTCRTVGPSIGASHEPLAHCRRFSSTLAQLNPLSFSWGRSTYYSDRLHDFSVTIPRCYKDVYANSFFPRTAGFWNSLPIECFFFL